MVTHRMALRDYQELALTQISKRFKDGAKKVLLRLPTGGGKTVIFSEVLKRTESRGNRCGMVVRGKQLVEQASQRLFREHVRHGVIQANHWNRDYGAKIHLCSIDTLVRRQMKPEWKLMVIDEAHLATGGGYKKFIEQYGDDIFILAVTATPYGKESLTHLADTVVSPISFQELIDQGYLVPPRYFSPSAPDLRGVRTVNNDYDNEELEKRMNVLTGNIVEHYKEIALNTSALLFAVNIEHSKRLAKQFNENGIAAEHIEGDDSLVSRQEAIKRLESGQTKVICSVNTMCTGVDIPFLQTVIMARPTKSYNLYVQQIGRGTRPYLNKNNFILLDHAGNVLRHGFVTDEPEVCLSGQTKEKKEFNLKTCSECYAIYQGMRCPFGCEIPVQPERESTTIEIEGKLIEISQMPKAVEIAQFIERSKVIQKKNGYKKAWLYYRVKEKYGEEIAAQFFPGRQKPWWMAQ